MVCEWGEERLSIRLKKIKRATGKAGRGGEVKPKKCIIPNFLYTAHSQRDALEPKKGQVTAAYLA